MYRHKAGLPPSRVPAPPAWQGRDTCWSVHTPVRYYLSAFGKLEEPGELSMMNE